MRLIAVISKVVQIRKLLEHIGVVCEPLRISPARGPPFWEACDAQAGEVFGKTPSQHVVRGLLHGAILGQT